MVNDEPRNSASETGPAIATRPACNTGIGTPNGIPRSWMNPSAQCDSEFDVDRLHRPRSHRNTTRLLDRARLGVSPFLSKWCETALAAMATLFMFSSVASAQISPDTPTRTKPAPESSVDSNPDGITAEVILSWIEDLRSESYSTRETASRKISRHLSESLPALIHAAESDLGDDSDSILQFLGFVGQDAISDDGKLAFECLKRIASERTTHRALVAQKVLESISIQMRDQAMERLRRTGITCENRYLSVLTRMKEINNALVIDQRFNGTASDLELLPWLFDVSFVKLEGPNIRRDVLALVAKMPKLNSLQIIETELTSADLECLKDAPDLELLEILYTPIDDAGIAMLEQIPIFGDLQLFGTQLSARGAKEVVDRIDTANVFVGRGGFLGITCEPSSLLIREVIPDGPAYNAGIRTLDKLLKIDDVAISNFDELRRELAKSAAGEKVMVEFERPLMSLRRIGNPGRDLQLENNQPDAQDNQGALDRLAPIRVPVTLGRRPSDGSR